MAAGRALVATAVGGIPEAVRDGVEALLVPPGDPAALGAALERLATDGELRRRLGESARRRFLERYTVEPMAAAYRDLYRDVLAGARGAAVAESVER
jgi:glycosyltransferase involved in cell wall biosynthesis